ncbi:MAG: GNAT family N-acetyltransferase [Planctomycetota bacterium]
MDIELISQPTGWSYDAWNALATAHPFLRWEWLGSWWNHYGVEKELFIVAIRENDEYVCFAPWFVENRISTGRTIQFLGNGKVCTDHMTLLCDPARAREFGRAIGEWLAQNQDWDHLELIGVDQNDPAISQLYATLNGNGLASDTKPGLACYGISLPCTWAEYQSRRSKSGKHECRKIRKWIDSGEFTFIVPKTQTELEEHWYDFVDMHQRRRQSFGEDGCFDFHPFGEFLWEASTKLIESGHLQLTMVYRSDTPIAAQYALKDPQSLYFYQSGLNVDELKFKPGQVVLMYTIADSIEKGRRFFDMMRGDESYKLRWRGEEQATVEYRVAATGLLPRMRFSVMQTGRKIIKTIRNARSAALTREI